ncbi:probable Dynein light chain 4, axonemal [Coccomyxa sp. Obi]|nr:probable Dynein light chain 4, axonemal [Coccomyxa sp. Obi]
MVIGNDLEAFYKTANYPLVNECDMLPEMREEAVDICVTAIEKYQADLEKATQVIKEALDKKFGGPWNCVAGNYFSFKVTHECKTFLHLYIGGKIGVLTWKL